MEETKYKLGSSSIKSWLKWPERASASPSPFWVIVQKEFGDHLRSWRFTILLAIIMLACAGSIYAALTALHAGAKSGASDSFLFLRIFTASDGTLPSFVTFVSFLGPLIGIALGFDAINSERSKGTLSRLLSQPLYRDDFIRAKFTAALLLIAVVLSALCFLVMGLGLLTIGYPPTPEEFLRVIIFLVVSIVYVAFWLNLSLLFSILFRQAATSALSGIALWIFFTVFYSMISGLIERATEPAGTASLQAVMSHANFMLFVNRLSPSFLFGEATSTLLMPEVRSLGPLTVEQFFLAIDAPLPLLQSLLLSWPQTVGMLAATMICFGVSYALFMRQEVRSRS